MQKRKPQTKQRRRRRPRQRKNNNNRQQQKVIVQQVPAVNRIQPCTKHYISALTNPFDLRTLPCIPDLHSIPTRKIKCITRGTMEVGSQGVGFILMNPHNVLPAPHALGTDTTAAILHSQASFAGIAAISAYPTSTPGGVVALGQAQMPYADTQYEYLWYNGTKNTRGLSVRPVGVGIRARYIGTTLNQSGRMILARHPDNGDFSGTGSAQLLAYQTINSVPVSRQWQTVCYKPTSSSDYEFSGNPITSSENQKEVVATVANSLKFCTFNMCILVEGAVPSSAFEFEVVSFYEIAGATDATTKSHTDLMGLSAVRNSTQSGPPTQRAIVAEKTLLHQAAENLNPIIKQLGRAGAEHLLKSATGGLLSLSHVGY